MIRPTKGLAAAVAAGALVFASVGTAFAADTTPTLTVSTLDDDLVLAVGKHFEAASVPVTAEVDGGSGKTTATTKDGRFVVAFSVPEAFTGSVTVSADDLSKTIRIGTAATGSSTTKAPKSTTTTTAAPSTTSTTTVGTDDEGVTPTTKATPANKSRTIKIMAFGDSIVSGQNLGGARTQLWKLFTKDGYAIDFVGGSDQEKDGPSDLPDKDHEGYSGWKTSDLLPKAGPALTQYDPDLIYVSMGGNDQFQGKLDEVDTNYRKIITTWCEAKPGIRIAAATNHDFGGKDFTELNAIIAKVVQDLNSPTCEIKLVRMEGVVQGELADGTHPNAKGYANMGDKWYPTLKAMADEVLAS